MLKGWVNLSLLMMDGTGRRNTSYRKPTQSELDAREQEFENLLFDLMN
jgi:hypothetical protein